MNNDKPVIVKEDDASEAKVFLVLFIQVVELVVTDGLRDWGKEDGVKE